MEILSILERYEKENTQKKDGEIKVITLNYRDIYSIGFIPDRFRYIEELYLNHNAIEQLNGIQQFPFLKLLSVKFNMIQSVDQFLLVLNKKSLTCLNFTGNPVEKDPSCTREFFLRTFPNLEELNDKNVNATGLKYIDTAPLTSRQQQNHQQIQTQQPNAMTVMTATDSLRSNSSQERAAAVQNLRPIHEEENTNTINTIIKPINKPIPKAVNLQDSAIILTDHYRYENLPGFNHQKTATFAQSQAWGNQSKHYFTNEEPMQLEMTERFTSSQILPFIADQSRINEQTYLQEKSIEFGLQNTMRRSKTPPKGVKASFRQDNSCIMESMNQDLSQMSNLFDKHIENIDKDIQDLARVFHEKSLKEKTMKGLMMGAGVDLEKNNKAIQFRNNIRLIRVFYAWVFYMNTTRRKEELIHAITDPKNKSQFQSAKKEGSLLLQKRTPNKENSPWQTIKEFTEFSDNEKTKRHNYFMTEDFM